MLPILVNVLVTANLGQYSVKKAENFVVLPVSGSLLADSTIYQPMQVIREETYYVLKTCLWIILGFLNPSNSQDLILNSLLELLCISL